MAFSLDSFWGVLNPQTVIDLADQFSERQFTAGDAGISSRIVTHWDSKDLLNYHREKRTRKKEEGWRYFDFVEFVWLLTVRELRDIGLPISRIKKVKDDLFAPVSIGELVGSPESLKEEIGKMNLPPDEMKKILAELDSAFKGESFTEIQITTLFLFLVHAIQQRQPYYLILFSNGDLMVWSESESEKFSQEDLHRVLFESQVRVSLTEMLKKFLTLDVAESNALRLKLVNEPEARILEILKSGKYKSVTVLFKSGNISSLELKKEQQTSRKIVDILSDNRYQSIEIKQHDGVITKIENTEKVNFDTQ